MSKIKEAYAVYTGGNIWIFYGQLEDGNYFLTDDYGWTQILNADPSDFDESLYEDWQKEHLVRELDGNERVKFCNHLLDYIYDNPQNSGGMSFMEIDAYRDYWEE